MSLERKDVRAKLDPDMHAALHVLCEIDQSGLHRRRAGGGVLGVEEAAGGGLVTDALAWTVEQVFRTADLPGELQAELRRGHAAQTLAAAAGGCMTERFGGSFRSRPDRDAMRPEMTRVEAA